MNRFNCRELQEYDYAERVQTVRISGPVSLTSETLLNVTIIDFHGFAIMLPGVQICHQDLFSI